MGNQLTALEFASPIGSVEAYAQQVSRVPMLSAQDEQDLARRFRDNNDLNAARQLILSHLRFVVHVAKGYRGYGLNQGDLIQEGNIGLMKAVKRFDPNANVRLVSFAVHWIRAEIHEFILRNWRIVKVATTKAQRKLFFNLRRSKRRLGWMNREEVAKVAQELGVKPETVLEMEARLSYKDTSFDPYVDTSDEQDSPVAPATYVSDVRYDPAVEVEASQWDDHEQNRLARALSGLNERSRAIVERRWLADDKATLHDLAREYNVSAERIRQIENAAMKQLKSALVEA